MIGYLEYTHILLELSKENFHVIASSMCNSHHMLKRGRFIEAWLNYCYIREDNRRDQVLHPYEV